MLTIRGGQGLQVPSNYWAEVGKARKALDETVARYMEEHPRLSHRKLSEDFGLSIASFVRYSEEIRAQDESGTSATGQAGAWMEGWLRTRSEDS
jgi:hypothetical protein